MEKIYRGYGALASWLMVHVWPKVSQRKIVTNITI